MNDIMITITIIVLAGVLLFVVPLVTMGDKVDDITQSQVEALVSNYVDEIRSTGKFTQEGYDKFLGDLSATGYTYDVEIEIKVMDENPGKKTSQTVKDKIGENSSYSKFNLQIEEELKKYGITELNPGDIVVVTARNSSTSLSQQMKQFVYKIVGNDKADVVASKAGMVQ
ncbi:MAG: hypothetical protein HFJ60_07220 [Clostridia bacterium]|jgi:hypothetical protein|nr:hypothetical protein [Clostridia bacterium]